MHVPRGLVQYLDDLLWPGLAATGIDRDDLVVDLSGITRLLAQVEPVVEPTDTPA